MIGCRGNVRHRVADERIFERILYRVLRPFFIDSSSLEIPKHTFRISLPSFQPKALQAYKN